MDIIGGVKSFVGGLLVGILSGAVLVMILLTIAQVVRADEGVSTREARLGEQDRSLNYKAPHYIADIHTYEVIREVESLTTFQCKETNLYLVYMVERIAGYIAQNLELGFIYKDALMSIRSHWCEN